MKRLAICGIALLLACGSAWAQAEAPAAGRPKTLDELLERVREGNVAEERENEQREQEFRNAKDQQQRLLTEALAAKEAAEKQSSALEAQFEANEKRIPELQETLRNRLGTLGELFGVARQVAGDTRAQLESSIISAQIPGRTEFLGKLAQSREMPSIDQLEKLWFFLQQEMTESGKVAKFPATVISVAGGEQTEQVTRVGTFNTVSDGRYLQYLSETGKLAELGRQPASRYLATADVLEAAKSGLVGFAIDPSRGSILSLLIQTPSGRERIDQGGPIGYTTIVLGVFAFLLAIYRLGYLGVVGRKMKAQIGRATADGGNPLGRVLGVYETHRSADVETLELKLDEAILKEVPRLERGQAMIKVISVVAPLLGLLGTVTGMIKTFQVMTLFGSGDPKLMASGIAEALVTTMIGLMVAIPLTLLYSMVSSRSRGLVQILEEQSAGLVATQAEAHSPPMEPHRVVAG